MDERSGGTNRHTFSIQLISLKFCNSPLPKRSNGRPRQSQPACHPRRPDPGHQQDRLQIGICTQTGSLLRTLAASKPSGKFLEIGTGTGIGTAWLLAGMDQESSLISVENDKKFIDVAQRFLSADPRVTFRSEDAGNLIEALPPRSFDLIFADTWAGKYTHLNEASNCSSRAASTSLMTCCRSRHGKTITP